MSLMKPVPTGGFITSNALGKKLKVNYSLNEVCAQAKKAARGVGYSWGLAEEAGKAASWLCQHDIDGCLILSERLSRMDGVQHDQWSPCISNDRWLSTGDSLCPVWAGSSLSDYAARLSTGPLILSRVAEPGLLIYFAALCAQRLDSLVTLSWNSAIATTDGIELSTDTTEFSGTHDVRIELDGVLTQLKLKKTRAEPAPETWLLLDRYASRTYAPATDESRLKGAGAGLSDSD